MTDPKVRAVMILHGLRMALDMVDQVVHLTERFLCDLGCEPGPRCPVQVTWGNTETFWLGYMTVAGADRIALKRLYFDDEGREGEEVLPWEEWPAPVRLFAALGLPNLMDLFGKEILGHPEGHATLFDRFVEIMENDPPDCATA